MHHETLFIPKQSDTSVYNCFLKLAKKHRIPAFSISALGHSSLGSVQVSSEKSPELNALLDQGVNLIQTASIKILDLNVTFLRGGSVDDPSPHHDTIKFYLQPERDKPTLEVVERIKLMGTLISDLRAFDPGRAIQGSSKEQNQLNALHQSVLDRLENTATSLIENLDKHAFKLNEQFRENEEKRSEDLEKHKNLLNIEHEKKSDKLLNREQQLDKLREEIDDRDNTHERRKLRGLLIKEIQSRSKHFKLTEDTNKLRWPVHAACIIGMFVLGLATILLPGLSGSASNGSIVAPTLFALRQVGLALGFVAIGFFYIRWLNRWFDQHSRAEFELKKFQLDIDRASWLVETSLEWKKRQGDVLPNILLNSLTRNLFSQVDGMPTEQLKHPADVLASALLGSASRADVKIGDSTLSFDGKKLRKQMAKE